MQQRQRWTTVTLAVAFAGLAAKQASAFGVGYGSVHDRVATADTIVVGETTRVDYEEVRPGQNAAIIEFRVSAVITGDAYTSGDTIAHRKEPTPGWDRYGCASFPNPEDGPHLLFITRTDAGREGFGCMTPADDDTIKAVKRQVEILADPTAFLRATDKEDAITLLEWIRRSCLSTNAAGEARIDVSGIKGTDRDRVVRFLTKHAEDDSPEVGVRAMELLTWLELPETFALALRALETEDDGKIALAARLLKQLGNKRALPVLLARFKRFDAQKKERLRRMERGEQVEPRPTWFRPTGFATLGWRPESDLLAAIFSFDDPRVAELQLALLDDPDRRSYYNVSHLAGDPRVVDALLSRVWEGDHGALGALQDYDDPRLAEQARERIYDHPFAPHILAEQGDPTARDFMIRLIRQGSPDGIRWACETADPSAKAELVRSAKYNVTHDTRSGLQGFALGRLRAFDMIPHAIEGLSTLDGFIYANALLYGFGDHCSFGASESRCSGEARWDCLREDLQERAAAERWAPPDRKLVFELFERAQHQPSSTNYEGLHGRWSPPEAMADMPDPLDKEATSAYLEQNRDRCKKLLTTGSDIDKRKLLDVAERCKVNLLDDEVARAFLKGTNEFLAGRVISALRAGRLTMTTRQIEEWALTGDYRSMRQALIYIAYNPKPEYAPLITRIFHAGHHLFDELLFRAIIETEAVECTNLLRAYLDGEHYALRYKAAVTLVHFGDEAGAGALRELEPNRKGCSRCLGRYQEAALEMIGYAP